MSATASAHAAAGHAAAPATTPGESYLRSRLGSFVAFAPLAIWTTNHLWNNLAVWQGGDAWQKAVTEYPHPFALFATSVMVFAPLLIHTVWGLSRIRQTRPNNGNYSNFDNLKFILQRASALGVLAFLIAHVLKAFISPRFFNGQHPEAFNDIAAQMHHHMPTLFVYVLGTLGVTFHLGNGISSLALSWGLAQSPKGFKRWEMAGIAIFLILLGMAWSALYGLWLAGARLPVPHM